MIDLTKLCDEQFAGDRKYIETPFSIGAHSYATNGHIIVRVPRRPDVPDVSPWFADKVLALVKSVDYDTVYVDLPPFADPPVKSCTTCKDQKFVVSCSECNGTALKTCPCCGGEMECKACDGGLVPANADTPDALTCPDCDGEIKYDRAVRVVFGKILLAPRYAVLLRELPGIQIAIHNDPVFPIPFRFDGGIGIIAPIVPSRHEDMSTYIVAGVAA